jgi:hypothetical protein
MLQLILENLAEDGAPQAEAVQRVHLTAVMAEAVSCLR